MGKMINLIIILALICMMMGVAAADVPESISASMVGNQIKTEVTGLLDDKYYQLRYYSPGNFDLEAYDKELDCGPYTLGPIINGSKCTDGNYMEYFTPDCQGTWTVVLLKGGDSEQSDASEIVSYRCVTVVNYVPEFPSIAVPVIMVLGMMFIFQRRKE